MPKTSLVPPNDVPICPDCQSDLSFVGSWSFRGLWGYNEVRTYECPAHATSISLCRRLTTCPMIVRTDVVAAPPTHLENPRHRTIRKLTITSVTALSCNSL
jgi:hypothetical protein